MGLATAIIAGAISANSVQAAPVALAKSVTAVALAKGAAASGSTLTLIKGALKIMAWTKAKTAIVAGVAVILATGTTTTILIEHGKRMSNHRPTASKLPTITQGETLDLQADGTIRFQMDLDVSTLEMNRSKFIVLTIRILSILIGSRMRQDNQ